MMDAKAKAMTASDSLKKEKDELNPIMVSNGVCAQKLDYVLNLCFMFLVKIAKISSVENFQFSECLIWILNPVTTDCWHFSLQEEPI